MQTDIGRLTCTDEQRAELVRLASDDAADRELARRARIILLTLDGLTAKEIRAELGVCQQSVYGWRKAFREAGLGGLADRRVRSGGMPPGYGRARDAVKALLAGPLPAGARSWTVGLISGELNCSPMRVREVLVREGDAGGTGVRLLPLDGDRPPADRETLDRWASGDAPSGRVARRARAVAMRLDGKSPEEIEDLLGVGSETLGRWCFRYASRGPAGLGDKAAMVQLPRELTAEERESLLALVDGPPPRGAGRWTADSAARRAGVPLASARQFLTDSGKLVPGPSQVVDAVAARPQEELDTLRSWASGGAPDPESAERARMVASVLDGVSRLETAARNGVSPWHVGHWAERFARTGPAALLSNAGRERLRDEAQEAVRAEVARLIETPPPDLRRGWNRKDLARAMGVSVHRVEKALAGKQLPVNVTWPVCAGIRNAAAAVEAVEALVPGSMELLGRWADGWDGTVPPEIAGWHSGAGGARASGSAPPGGHFRVPKDTARALAWRAAVVRMSLKPRPIKAAAEEAGVPVSTCRWWKRRFLMGGPAGILPFVTPGRGDTGLSAMALRAAALVASPPPPGMEAWDDETAARFLKIGPEEVGRLLERARRPPGWTPEPKPRARKPRAEAGSGSESEPKASPKPRQKAAPPSAETGKGHDEAAPPSAENGKAPDESAPSGGDAPAQGPGDDGNGKDR